jgi:hypothetical protein
MSKTIVAVYDSQYQVKNAIDDLIATGIPLERIRSDDAKPRVEVTVADTAHPEIAEILERHQPAELAP